MNTSKTWAFAGALVLWAASAPLYARGDNTQQGTQVQTTTQARAGTDIKGWNQAEMRGGISANRLVGMDVRGNNGNSIGEIQHVLVNQQGKVTAIVIESGGFMNVGDTHFRIPWNQVRFSRDMDHVVVPMTEKQAEQWSEKRARERVQTGAGEFRLSELRDDGVTLRDGTRYGQIEDVILSRNGEVKAVIVDRQFGPGGHVAYPFNAVTFDDDRNTAALGYDRDQVADVRPFEYRTFDIAEPRATGATRSGATGATGGTDTGATTGVGGEQRMDRERRPARQFRG